MLEPPKNKDNEDFDIPNEVVHEDLPMPTQEELQKMVDRQSLEYRGPEVDVYDYNPNDEQSIYDPDFELGDRTYQDIKGWTLLYPDNINDAPLTIGFKDAKLFFPASDGEIKGVMPTLQDTDEPLDQKDSGGDLDIPKITISGSGEYTQWMLYDSTNDTARIFVIKDDEDINQEKLSSESKLAIGSFEVDGGVIKDYTLDIPGPEAIGGGVVEDTCKPFEITDVAPKYLVDPGNTVPPGSIELWVKLGNVNNVMQTNYDQSLVISVESVIYIEVDLAPNDDRLSVTNVEVKVEPGDTVPSNGPWPPPSANSFALPSHINLLLGRVTSTTTGLRYYQSGGTGNFNLVPIVSNVRVQGLLTTMDRDISVERI